MVHVVRMKDGDGLGMKDGDGLGMKDGDGLGMKDGDVLGMKDGDVLGMEFPLHCAILPCSSKDTFVKLWDLDTYHCFQTVVGHKSEV